MLARRTREFFALCIHAETLSKAAIPMICSVGTDALNANVFCKNQFSASSDLDTIFCSLSPYGASVHTQTAQMLQRPLVGFVFNVHGKVPHHNQCHCIVSYITLVTNAQALLSIRHCTNVQSGHKLFFYECVRMAQELLSCALILQNVCENDVG